LLKDASSGIGFFEMSLYVDNVMESVLAPLVDVTMHDNPGIYIKSHPRGAENTPHLELHFSLTTVSHPEAQEKLRKAMAQLSKLVEANGGKVIPVQHARN